MEIQVDRDAGLLFIDEREIKLTPAEWAILIYLMDNNYTYRNSVEIGIFVNYGCTSIRWHISRLRRKTGIKVEHRKDWGYRLKDVEWR